MIKFWLIYVMGGYISYKSITARKTKELARMQKEERWTELRITINDLLFPVVNVLGILLLIFFMLPLTRDLPNAARNIQKSYVGIVDKVECDLFCLKQNVYVNLAEEDNSEIGKNENNLMKIKVYFNKDIKEGDHYEIKYLPKSKFGVEITSTLQTMIEEGS